MDTGLLLIRIVVGVLFMGHGAQKLFGWFGGHGIEGTGGFFHSLGYRPGKAFATVGGLSEFFGGLCLALGFLTPLAAAAIIGMMFNAAMSVHVKNGVWVTNGGVEYPLVLATAAAAMAFIGPGAASLDNAFGWDLAGEQWGIAALAVGIGGGAIVDLYRRIAVREPRFRRRGIRSPA